MSSQWKSVENAISINNKQTLRRINYVPSQSHNNKFSASSTVNKNSSMKDSNNKNDTDHKNGFVSTHKHHISQVNEQNSNNSNSNSTSNSYSNSNQNRISEKGKSEFGLCDPEIVKKYSSWATISKVGPGFYNDGNSCYLNSTLQCLLYTPPLVQILQKEAQNALKGVMRREQNHREKAIILHFLGLVQEVWSSNSQRAISPRSMVSSIRRVGRQFKPMRQEDAHEYLRKLVDCMHEEVLKANGVKTSDGKIAETTVISRIFGGYLCNTLSCSQCSYTSKTYNHFQDISLEIPNGVNSIKSAIEAFVKPEYLSHGNEWKCDKCKKKVKAKKQMTIHKTPQVLVLHLKRFSYGNMHGKVSKHIAFSDELQVPCTGDTSKIAYYKLCGVVVHHGHSTRSGHYVAMVKAPNGQWYEMNDSLVSQLSTASVFSKQAYILFYSRVNPAIPVPPTNAIALPQSQQKIIGQPILSKETINNATSSENEAKIVSLSKSSKIDIKSDAEDVGEVIKPKGDQRKNPLPISSQPQTNSVAATISTTADILPAQREKLDSLHRLLPVSAFKRLKNRNGYVLYAPLRWRGPIFDIFKWSWRGKRKLRDLYSLLSPNTEANQLSPITKTVDTVSSENATEQSKHVKISQSDSSSSNNSSSSEDSDSEDEMKRIDSEKSSKNVQNGKTLNGRASLTNRSSNNSVDLFQQLLSASNRGREVGGEGLWDTVSSELADVVREKAVKQRRLEQVERKARISSEWDQQLDRGRSKKIKLKDSNKTMSNENLFQKVQNQRLQNN